MNAERNNTTEVSRHPAMPAMAGIVLTSVFATATGFADEVVETRVIVPNGGETIFVTGDGAGGSTDLYFGGASPGDVHEMSFGEAHAVEVKIVDGDVQVKVDGEEIPAPQVIRKDGSIVILDESGNEVRVIDTPGMGKVGDFGFRFGGGDGEMWFGQKGEGLFTEPKVMLGLHLSPTGPALERHLGLEAGTTTLVSGLYEGLPADAAGLEQYDIITAIDGATPADPKSLHEAMAAKEPGDVVRFRLIHEGEPRTVRVTLSAYDREAMSKASVIGDAMFGPNMLGTRIRVPGVPGADSLFDFDFDNVKDLNRFFLDDSNRLFEAPHGRAWLQLDETDGANGEKQIEVKIDSRLSRLDSRLEALEEMLDALLAEAKKPRER